MYKVEMGLVAEGNRDSPVLSMFVNSHWRYELMRGGFSDK